MFSTLSQQKSRVFKMAHIKWCPSINLYRTQIEFPMQKLAIFRKVKEIKELRGGVQVVLRTSNSAD
jgi:hypothetical protein